MLKSLVQNDCLKDSGSGVQRHFSVTSAEKNVPGLQTISQRSPKGNTVQRTVLTPTSGRQNDCILLYLLPSSFHQCASKSHIVTVTVAIRHRICQEVDATGFAYLPQPQK